MGIMAGGKGGGKNALAAKPNLLNALRVQTSSYGQVVPIVYGQNRISGRLIWSGDFAAIPHTSTQKVGGKGLGSGGGNAISNTTYTYQSAVATALCFGPIQNIHNVWDTKGRLTLVSTSVPFTVPPGGGSFLPPPDGRIFHSGIGVSRADSFSLSVDDYGSDGSFTLAGTQQTPMVLVGSSPGAGQYLLNTSTGQHTFSSADAGKTMTINYVYSEPDSNSNGQPQQKLNLTLFTGQRPQNPWSYLTSKHSGQDLGYSGVAYVASSAMDLGESGTLPNLSFEVLGILPFSAGITDCNPSDVINDVMSNPFYGLGTGFYRIQSMGGSTFYKYYLDFGLDTAGVQYGLNITVTNAGTTPVAVNNNHGGSVTIQPGVTQNVSLPFTGTGASNVQLLFYTVNSVSDSINVLARDPALFKISDGINMANSTQRTFAGWNLGPGASVTVMPDPQVPLGDLTQYSNYCVANGIFLSPVLDSQKSAADWIQDILDVTNSAAVWSEGLLKIVPYGDTTAVGNGATFLPNTSPIYDLSSNDLLNPVTVKRPSISDVMNSVSVEFLNRDNDYNVEIAEDKDDAMIAVYGLRKASPKQAHSITTTAVAKQVANFLRKREVEIRATYTLTLGWQFNLLEPMDLVTLTIPELGYNKKPVRITAIRENDSGQLEMDAEDFPFGTASPTLYPQQGPGGFIPQANADAGSVNTPIVFEAPFQMSRNGQHEIWMAVSGSNPNWGGCHVWISQDNSEYHQIGQIFGSARMGICGGAGTFGVTGDPYTGGVSQTWDLTQSRGVLNSGTQQDADSYRTLVYFDGEFMSYANLTLVSANVYNPAGYIRRGLFGSTIASHSVGSPVVRLDDSIFTYVYDPSFIGKTIYLKFTSFNTSGLMEQSIANATAYQFIVTGKFCEMETVSKNLLANPGFESNVALTAISTYPSVAAIPSGLRISDSWSSWNGNGFASIGDPYLTVDLETSLPHSGSRCILLINKPGAILPNDSHFYVQGAISDKVAINPGESYSFGGWIRLVVDGSLPAGVNWWGAVRVILYDASGNILGQITYSEGQSTPGLGNGNPDANFLGPASANTFNGGYYLQSTYFTVPALFGGAKPAFAAVWCTGILQNAGAAAWTMSGLQIDARFDDCFLFPQWDLTGDEIGKQGSISNTYTGGLTYTSTTNSITWNWNITASRTDSAMTINTYSGSQTITGLSAGTSYNFYPFIDEIKQIVTMVATGGVGSPSWAHVGTSVAWTQEQARGDHFPLSSNPLVGVTTTTGTGGGGGGGIGGACLRYDVLVREKTKGVIQVRELEIGDWVSCPCDEDTPDGWAEVIAVGKDCISREWVHTFFNADDWLATTPGHPFTLEDGSTKRAAQLSLENAVPCVSGVTYPTNHILEIYSASKISVSIRSSRHVFYAGMKTPCILQHNLMPES